MSEPDAEITGPGLDEYDEAQRLADRPGFEGGVSFWDLWRAEQERRGSDLIEP